MYGVKSTEQDSPLVKGVESIQPDFARIYEALKREANILDQFVSRLTGTANSIKLMPPMDGPLEQKEKHPESLVEFLWAEIWKIERTNRQLEKIVSHLHETVGT